MNLKNSILVAVAMMLGSMGALGCNTVADKATEEVVSAPAEQPAAAVAAQPAANAPVAAAPQTYPDARFQDPSFAQIGYAPIAPPALRVEIIGVAPRADMYFVPGYWRYSGARYVWVSGRWESGRDGYDYAPPRWERVGSRWQHRPGCWIDRRTPSRPRADVPVNRPHEPHAGDRRPHDHRADKPIKDHDRDPRPLADRKDGPKHDKHDKRG